MVKAEVLLLAVCYIVRVVVVVFLPIPPYFQAPKSPWKSKQGLPSLCTGIRQEALLAAGKSPRVASWLVS